VRPSRHYASTVSAELSAHKASPERQWWLRTLAIFQSPRAVFAALRDDSEEQAAARQEPVLALVFLAGIAGVLSARETGRLLDYREIDAVLVAVVTFLSGGIYAFVTYWLGGALLHLGIRAAGGEGSYRRSRHVLAFAAAPLALSLLLVWPLRLAVYGGDSFRAGGADEGAGYWIFTGISIGFAAWAFVLLVLGVSVVQRWTLGRAAVSIALIGLTLAIITTALLIPLSTRS
jgi:hypothetical protein